MGPPPLPRAAKYQPRQPRREGFPVAAAAALLLVLYLLYRLVPSLNYTAPSRSAERLASFQLTALDAGLQKCREFYTPVIQYDFPVPASRHNPRWNPSSGQNKTVLLRNATLFDGTNILARPVDILFKKGVVISITPTSKALSGFHDVQVADLDGKYVTPGLVDMHSHHMAGSWPAIPATDDVNEMNPATGPLTPMVRVLDSLRADDQATTIIASGGVTSSLILPGSANIMGGEGVLVKNVLEGGPHGEVVVEELLLEHGIPETDRRRYMKMACGENPRSIYDHTRMGDTWVLRKQLTRAKQVQQKQDSWCLSAAAAREGGNAAAIAALVADGGLPESLELESTVLMLRGKININVHCYETEDFETMLRVSKEFNFRVQAFRT